MNQNRLDPVVIEKITALIGDRFTTSQAVRDQHGRDASFHAAMPPDGVAFVESTEEVSQIAKICFQYDVPMIPFGVGSSLEGHILALNGGISIDLSGMTDILSVNAEDQDCRVQAGVTREQLDQYLRADGLFFPIDPGAHASLGGMVATSASGTNAVKYGTMKENVLGLTVVMSDGRIVTTGGRSRKSSAGDDMTSLFVGSEGTLGIVTEIQLRLHGRPEQVAAAVCSFDDLENAVQTVIATIQVGVPVARMELLDAASIAAVNQHSHLSLSEKPTLFYEFHGTENGVKEQSEIVSDIVQDFGGGDFDWATREEDRNRLWRARHEAFWATKELKPNHEVWSTDVCVPVSILADCIVQTQQDIDENDLTAPILGHVGDGNFHVLILLDPDNEEDVQKATAFNSRLVKRALDMGGTCTGEHGIGLGKMGYLEAEQSTAIPLMRDVKSVLDPKNLMNPGKIFRLKDAS